MTSPKTLLRRFASAGYGITFDERKRRYQQGMLRLLGGLESIALLRDESIVRLLSNAQLKKGTAYSLRELISIAQPREQIDRFSALVHQLAGKQVLLRGYRLRCPECDLELWYDIDSIDEFTLCAGCRSTFQLPLEQPFAYRLNQLFIAGLNQGALTVLLTILYLQPSYWETNLVLKRDGQISEIDLIAQTDKGVIIVECKDNYAFDDPMAVNQLCAQFDNQRKIAGEVDAYQFVFATLYDETLSDDNQVRIKNTSQDNVATIILTRDLLLTTAN